MLLMTAFTDSIVITGPTASGKSALALQLAERAPIEIIAMDSMTIYRELDIGTAKPTPDEQALVPHHLVDVLDPSESGTVAWWLAEAKRVSADIRARNRTPVFVGGTPFYLKSLLFGLFDAPPVDPQLRQRLEAEAEALGVVAFHAKLSAVDPKTAARLHPNDVRRVVRALEVYEQTGRPISESQHSWDTIAFGGAERAPNQALPVFVLEWPREELSRRIDARVVAMMNAGWLDEARRLLERQPPLSREASAAVGYRELWAYLCGDGRTRDEVIATIQLRTRQFAKRQLTWFRSLRGTTTLTASEGVAWSQLSDTIATRIAQRHSGIASYFTK
jgi:tRNA dimethylallyltransferase